MRRNRRSDDDFGDMFARIMIRSLRDHERPRDPDETLSEHAMHHAFDLYTCFSAAEIDRLEKCFNDEIAIMRDIGDEMVANGMLTPVELQRALIAPPAFIAYWRALDSVYSDFRKPDAPPSIDRPFDN